MSEELERIAVRMDAIEIVLLEVMKIAAQRDPDLHEVMIQKLNSAITDIDDIQGVEDVDPDKPRTRVAKDIKAIRDQFIELTRPAASDR